MRIGMISTRLAGVDGVSLETAKLVTILERRGHTCFYCAGELGEDGPPGKRVPAMHFTHPAAQALHDEAFASPQVTPDFYARMFEAADDLRAELGAFVEDYDIDLLIPQNAATIPMNLALGVALRDLVERRRIPMLCHHHDFYWERERFLNHRIGDILDTAFPPDPGPVQHMVINSIAQKQLEVRRGIRAALLPNVFDYKNPPPEPDAYAQTFREALWLDADDLIVLQPTRMVRRKAIEKAIELVRKLDDPRLVLLVTGYEGDEAGGYGGWLREEAERSGIRYRFIADYVDESRGERDGHRVYTLWDIYPHAHIVTYPSVIEGFGNALLETLYFRKPLVVHTYPVYLADIKPAGVQAVEFHHDITDEVLAETRRLIDDARRRERMAEHNYNVALEHFSYEAAERVLARYDL